MEAHIETWLEEIVKAASIVVPTNRIMPENLTINQVPKSDHLRLPSINIQSFSGGYHKWTDFRSLIKSLVHNKADITSVEKFHHL